jgi:membrane protease YdiL (CAAX protease family)
VVLVAALVFAVAHTHQRAAAAAGTALAAVGFTALFVASGSRWLPIVLHALVDLRFLLLCTGDQRAPAPPTPAPSPG